MNKDFNLLKCGRLEVQTVAIGGGLAPKEPSCHFSLVSDVNFETERRLVC